MKRWLRPAAQEARAALAALVEIVAVTSVIASDFRLMKSAQECVASALAVLVVVVDYHHLVAYPPGSMSQYCDPKRRLV